MLMHIFSPKLYLALFFWQMPIGRNCVNHYRQLSRYCVFSHDEMVCNMAFKAETMEVELASACLEDMTSMIQEERELREKISKMVRSLMFRLVGFSSDQR